MKVIVVGGGISGLTVAQTMLQRARDAGADVDVTVLEALDRPGGHAWTIREEGFMVEAGPNGFLDRELGPAELAGELGVAGELVEARPEAKRRFILRGGRLRRMPESPPSLVSSDALSVGGKLRLLLEPWARPAPEGVEESVHEFARRRVGPEAAEALVDAAISGISAGDSRELSVSAAFPLMIDLERKHGSLIRGMMVRRGRRSRLMTFAGGLGSLVDRLASCLGDRVQTGARVTSLRPVNAGWCVTLAGGKEQVAERVVLASPAHATARILADLDPELSGVLDETPYAGLSLVALAYRMSDVSHPLAGYGYLVTRAEGLRTLGVVWESSLFEGRAPRDTVLLRVFIGGTRHPGVVDLPESEVESVARRELQGVLGVSADPIRTWVFRWPEAIAQYTRGHIERVRRCRELAARHPGLDLLGTAYDGISFSSAITAARRHAARMSDELVVARPVTKPAYEVVGGTPSAAWSDSAAAQPTQRSKAQEVP